MVLGNSHGTKVCIVPEQPQKNAKVTLLLSNYIDYFIISTPKKIFVVLSDAPFTLIYFQNMPVDYDSKSYF